MRFKRETNSDKYSTIPHNLHNSVEFHDITKNVDTLLIFQRISFCKHSNDDKANYLQYELSPYPLSIFYHCEMLMEKNHLYKIFQHSDEVIDLQQQTLLVAGGFLLHKAVWKKKSTKQYICNTYIKYVMSNY